MSVSTPQPLAVRQRAGQWEVLIANENRWFPCEAERDARTIAHMPVFEYEALERMRPGAEFAAELDELADTLEKYRVGFGTRFFRWCADEARRNP